MHGEGEWNRDIETCCLQCWIQRENAYKVEQRNGACCYYQGRFSVTVCMVPHVRGDASSSWPSDRDLHHDGTILEHDLRPNIRSIWEENEQFLKSIVRYKVWG